LQSVLDDARYSVDSATLMTIDPAATPTQETYKLLIGAIVPRPIAFVSSLNPDGRRNLAPFSFFTVASVNPPVLCFAPLLRGTGGGSKDTLRNIENTREFVVNIVSEAFAGPMNACSGDYPPEVDEFAISKLTPLESEAVTPPRVAESPVQMECKLLQVVRFGTEPLSGSLVLGQMVRMHVNDNVLTAGKIDPDKLRAIGRMGGPTYARTTDRFDLQRPVV
jgi:flavin reductase (DIM6/NTAB) family NADH-FMN oxidoreductase RutF